MKDEEVAAKFRRLAVPTITEQQCDQALELLWSLESLTDLDEALDSLIV